jgi:hypothetical protein
MGRWMRMKNINTCIQETSKKNKKIFRNGKVSMEIVLLLTLQSDKINGTWNLIQEIY